MLLLLFIKLFSPERASLIVCWKTMTHLPHYIRFINKIMFFRSGTNTIFMHSQCVSSLEQRRKPMVS